MRSDSRARLWFAICLLWLFPSPVLAQVTHGPPRIRNVYIPADQLKVLFDNSSEGVLMPRDKVLALWQEAQRHLQSQAVVPADTVLSQATYAARLDEHQLRLDGRIQIAKLQRGWQAVDLPFGGLALESARLGGEPARFGRKDDGTLFLLVKEEGRFDLELEMSAPLASKGGDLAATLKLPPVPASEVVIRLDQSKQLELGELTLEPDRTDNAEQVFRVAVDQTGLVPLVVSDRFGGGNRTPLVLADSRSICHIEPAGLRWEVALNLDVYARPADTFQLQLPGSVDVAEIEAPQLERWTLHEQTEGTATVTLTFRKPLLGRTAVRLLGLAPIPLGAPWNVPTVKVLDAASHVGQVLVYPSPSLRVELGTPAGIMPDRLPLASGAAAGLSPLAFAFWEENFILPLRIVPREQSIAASVATLVEVDRAGLVLRGSVAVQPRHAPLFGVQLELPRDWDVTSVLAAGEPMEWESDSRRTDRPSAPGGTDLRSVLQTVRFDLARPLNPGQSLEIAISAERHPDGWLERDETFSELPLPELRLAGADEVEGTVLLQAPADIELLVSDLSDDLEPVAADRSRTAVGQTAGTALQYHYQDDARVSGRLQVRGAPAKMAAETLAFVRLDRGKLDVHYQLDLHIRRGKVRQIGFTLPAAVGEKIQIVPIDSPARVIEQRHSPSPGAGESDGELNLWQIVLDRPVSGDLTLALGFGETLSTPFSPGTRDGRAGEEGQVIDIPVAPVEVPVLTIEDISGQTGMVAVEAAGDQQIDCRAENLRDLDPADVAKPRAYVPSQRIVAAYQYGRLPYRLAISATRHTSESVLTAICESAEVTSIAGREPAGGRSGRMHHQARFSLRSVRAQDVPVILPDGADLWSAMLDGEPVEIRRTEGTCVISLPAAAAGSAADLRELTLLYETESPHVATSGFWRRLWPLQKHVRQRAPEIVRDGMATLGTTWSVYPPGGTDVVSSGGDFRPDSPLARPTLVARLAETIARHSTSGLGWKLGGLVAAAFIVGFFALVRTGTRGRFTVVELLVVIVVIGMLIALLLPSVQSAREAARRTQCVNNLKQIALALHNYHDAHGHFPPAVIGPNNVPPERQFSWLVAILPYMEQKPLYDKLRLDLPCDDPQNAALLRMPLESLLCPSDVSPSTQEGLPNTSYVAITGADWTLGSGSTRGVIGLDKGLSIDDIADGTSNTIMVAEVTDGGPWFAGGRGTARRIDDWIEHKTWSGHPEGGNFAFADGSVHFLGSATDPQTLRHLATAQGLDEIADEEFGEGAVAEGVPATVGEAAPSELMAEQRALGGREAISAHEDHVEQLAPQLVKPEARQLPQAPAQPETQRGERARLSLRVVLEPHEGQAIRFHREGGGGELVLGLQDRTFARTLQWLLVAAGLLAAWIWRRARGPRQAIAVVAGLAVPIGLSGLVPLAWTPLLDGLLLGALAAGCSWILLKAIAAIKTIKTAAVAPAAAAVAIAISLLVALNARAAEEPPVMGTAQTSNAPERRPDLTLFIPYDPGKGKPLQSTQVYLPHDEFLRLWKQAHPDKPGDVLPGVRAMVSHAEYSGQLQGDIARFDGRILIHHLDDQWVRVELPLGEVALEKVEINGRPATLAGGEPPVGRIANPSGTQSHSVLQRSARVSDPAETRPAATPLAPTPPAIYLDQPGPHVLDVRFSVPVSRLGATGQMIVPLRAVPSGRLVFQLPAEDLDVQVSGCPGGWRRQVRGSDEFVAIPLGAAGELGIRWQPRRIEARTGQLVSVDHAMLVEVLDSGVHLRSRFHYRIQQGALSELGFRIPPGMAVGNVQGAEVADWSIETESAAGDDPPAQRLVVVLKTELTTGTDVDVYCFRRDRLPVGSIDIGTPQPLGVTRETGRIAIGCSDHFRVRVDKTDRLDQINRVGLDLPETPRDGCALLSAYRYTSRPWRLGLQIDRHQPRVEVSDRTAVAVAAQRATLRSLLTAHVTGAPVPSFTLRLPASLRVSQVRVPPGADWFVGRDDKGQRLQVELSEPALGDLNLAVSGSLARDAGQAEFVVPGVTVEAVHTQHGQLAILLDDDLEGVLADDGGARPIDPAALDGVLRPDGGGAVRYAFQYESPPENLRLRLATAPSRSSADVTTVVSVREGAVAYVSNVNFEIRQAGRRQFRIVTPLWLGDDVELQAEHVRQIRSQTADRGRTWDIELQQPVRGTYRVQLIQTLPLPDDGTVPAALIRPLDVERSRNHVVLENLTADEVVATTTRGAAPVPIAAVPEGLTDAVRRQAVAAYRVADDDAELAWQRRVRPQESGLLASISLADLTTVIGADGRYRARAAYNIRNFTLQFLELELPPDSQIWSVQVSGQPVRPARVLRQGRSVTLLPLEKTSAGDFSSKIVVIYSGCLGEALHRWSQLSPPAPRVQSDIPVSRTLWTVLVPREYILSLVKGQSNLEQVAAAYQQEERKLSFLDEVRQMVQVASTKSKSAARTKAIENLMQAGSAVESYAQQRAPVDAKNAADVQQQAQQIGAEIRRLEELKTDAKRPDADTDFYFAKPQRPEAARAGVDLDRPRPEERRGKLRQQAAEQLQRLQTVQQEGPVQQPSATPQQQLALPEGGQVAPGAAADVGTIGYLPFDVDLAVVGTAYHFRKLHGEPRLVLSARHESLGHRLIAIVWAGLCLAMATVVIQGLRRPDAASLAHRGWPWLAAVAGTAWLFLLPAGVLGLVLLVTALCVLIARLKKPRLMQPGQPR